MALDLETRHALLAGRASYRDLAHGRVPWLDSPLVATDEARQRLLEWAEGGGLDRAPFTREEIRTRLDACHFGDDELGALALDVLGRIAPPARDYVLTHTWVLTVGRRTSGWTNPAPAPPAGDHHLVVVHGRDRTDDEIRSTLGHELRARLVVAGSSAGLDRRVKAPCVLAADGSRGAPGRLRRRRRRHPETERGRGGRARGGVGLPATLGAAP